jgi:GH24 family phage-related lysozyme (muramidase)
MVKLTPVDYNPFEVKPETPFYEQLPKSMGLGLLKGGAGVAEAGLNAAQALGVDVAPQKENIANWQNAISKAGENTGITGVIGEAIGDPRTYLNPLKGSSFMMQGATSGAIQGLTNPTGNKESTISSNIKNAGENAAFGAAAGKVMGAFTKPSLDSGDDAIKAASELLKKEGVTVGRAAESGSKVRRTLENAFAELPTTSGKEAALRDKSMEQFNRAVLAKTGLSKAGAASSKATPETMDKIFSTLGKRFENIASKTTVKVDNELLNNLAEIEQEAQQRLGSDASKGVRSYINDIIGEPVMIAGSPMRTVKLDTIAGKTYQNTRSRLSKLSNSSADPYASHLLKLTRNALDAAAERSMPANLQGVWKDTNTKYEAAKIIDKAMKSSGSETLKGNISPTQLLMAARNNPQYTRGGGVLNDLARAGGMLLRDPVANSGTAQRTMAMRALTGSAEIGAPAALGAGIGAAVGGIPAIAGGAVIGLGLPKAAQALYYSDLPEEAARIGANTATNIYNQYQDEMTREENKLSQPTPKNNYNLTPVDYNPFETTAEPTAPQGNAGSDTLETSFTQQNEGNRLVSYKDTGGNRTIGYGFNFNSGIAPKIWKEAGIQTPFRDAYLGKAAITPQEATALYHTSNKVADDDARSVYNVYDTLGAGQQEALRDLAYHHGKPALEKNLKYFNIAINSGKINTAISILSKSKYAEKFPERASLVIDKLIGG